MHFMIPKNYKIKPKLLGLIDYQAALIDGIWAILLYVLVNLFLENISLKFYFFIGGFIPMLLFSIVGFQNESMVSVIKYLIKYTIYPKIYLYRKIHNF